MTTPSSSVTASRATPLRELTTPARPDAGRCERRPRGGCRPVSCPAGGRPRCCVRWPGCSATRRGACLGHGTPSRSSRWRARDQSATRRLPAPATRPARTCRSIVSHTRNSTPPTACRRPRCRGCGPRRGPGRRRSAGAVLGALRLGRGSPDGSQASRYSRAAATCRANSVRLPRFERPQLGVVGQRHGQHGATSVPNVCYVLYPHAGKGRPRGAASGRRGGRVAGAGDHGFGGLTLRAVATEIGASTGLLTHYFTSKRDLVRYAHEVAAERTDSRGRAQPRRARPGRRCGSRWSTCCR